MDKRSLLREHFKNRIIELERAFQVIKKSSPRNKLRLRLIKETIKTNMEMYKKLKKGI